MTAAAKYFCTKLNQGLPRIRILIKVPPAARPASKFDVVLAGRLIALRNACRLDAASFISAIFYPLEETNHES